MNPNLEAFKLAGLRAGALVEAAAQDSALVRSAMKFNLWRKNTKLHIRRFFKRLRTKTPATIDKLRILVHIRGGIGDVCMTRVFIKKLRDTLPHTDISFAFDDKKIVDMVFSDGLIDHFEPLGYLPEHFDVVISGCHYLMYDFINWPRVKKLAPQLLPILEKGLDVQRCFKPFATYTPYLDGQLAAITVANGGGRITNLGWFSGLVIEQKDEAPLTLDPQLSAQILAKHGLTNKKYITIHDGINTNTDTSSGHPTRCWPETHWREFARLFKASFPNLQLVQLGAEKSQIFEFVDISLVGKTPLLDLPHILGNARLHVDGESGMVHIAHLASTNSVVLFGPTPVSYFGYACNTNIQSPICGGCMNITKHWMTHCVLGYPPEKQCLAAITPQQVFEAVKNRLS